MKTKKSRQKGGWKTSIQTFGRSLLLPIAVLAPIGMLMGTIHYCKSSDGHQYDI